MDERVSREMQAIQKLQGDLRWRLDALDRRIEELGKQAATDAAPPLGVEKLPQAFPDLVVPIMPPQVSPPPPLPPREAEIVQSFQPEEPAAPLPPVVTASLPPPPAATNRQNDSLELRVGRVWLVRIGIVLLLTGLVFLGNLAWTEFITRVGPVGKLALIYLAGLGLGAIGWLVKRKREELAAYGKVLIGGGIATIYYATYAAHFVEPLRVISSPLLGGVLLMGLAAGIIWLADRLRSEGIAGATVVLGFYTAAINPVASFSLFSNLVLSVIAIVLLLRRRWHAVSFLSLVGCYAAFAFWRVQATGTLFAFNASDSRVFWTALLFPACYWAVFTAATLLGRSRVFAAGTLPIFLTINNGAFFALSSPLMAGTYPREFWIFALIYGGVLIGLSLLAEKIDPEEQAFDGSYLAQGLTLVFLAMLLKFTGYQLALMLALSSVALMRMSKYRQGMILQVSSGVSAVLAAAFSGFALLGNGEHSEITAAGVAVILAATAWMFKFHRGLLKPLSFQWRAMGLVALATGLGVATIWQGMEVDRAFYYCAGLAVLATASVYLLRMPELVFAAQGVAAVAVLQWYGQLFLHGFDNHQTTVPFSVIAAVLLALTHWWQHQRVYSLGVFWRMFWQSAHAAALVAVIFAWMLDRFPGTHGTLALAVGGLILLAYAFLTRAWPLAIGSQLFSAVAVEGLMIALYDKTSWSVALATLVVFSVQSLVIEVLGSRVPESAVVNIRIYSQVLRVVSVCLGLYFIEDYTPEPWLFLTLAGIAFAFFGIGTLSRKSEALAYAAAAILLGYWAFAVKNLTGQPVFGPDFAGLALILLAQQVGKRRLATTKFFGIEVQAILITAGVAGIWLVMHRMVAGVESGFLLTASWSLLAFVVLGTGFLLKERTYRLLGLGLLAVTIVRLFFVDIRQLERVYQILSFMVLGVVLLTLGFLYNRFADTIRKWI